MKVDSFTIPATPKIDEIEVFVTTYGPKQARVTIASGPKSWTTYFNSMPDDDWRTFLRRCPRDYLTGKLAHAGITNAIIDFLNRAESKDGIMPMLLPCPFCGSTKVEIQHGSELCRVRCIECGSRGATSYYTDNDDGTFSDEDGNPIDEDEPERIAADAWNRRVL